MNVFVWGKSNLEDLEDYVVSVKTIQKNILLLLIINKKQLLILTD